MRVSFVICWYLLSTLSSNMACSGESIGEGDAEVDGDTGATDISGDADSTGQCVRRDWYNEESGCTSDMICIGEQGCYPRAGLPDGSCDQPSTINIRVSLRGAEMPHGGYADHEWNGIVLSVSSTTLELDADNVAEAVVVDYDIGAYQLPVVVGDRIRLRSRITQPFGVAQGFAIWSVAGDLLAVVDDGGYGSAWAEIPGGFTVRTEIAGCPVKINDYSAVMRMAIRVMHEGADDLIVPPGEPGILTMVAGERFMVVNAYAEHFVYMLVTDTVPRVSWIILRAP